MTSTFHAPNEDEVRQILVMLFGEELELKSTAPTQSNGVSREIVAVYIDDNDEPVAACVSDLQFAAFAGSALTRIPRGGAEDAASCGQLSEVMLGNLHEIMNICSRLFMNSHTPHLRLGTLYSTSDTLPDNAMSMIGSCQKRVDYRVDIPAYGNGALSFLCT